jgi:general secretion pathway protein F
VGAFEYEALDLQGRRKTGTVEGDTPRQARQFLRDQGLTPLAVDPIGEKRDKRSSGVFGGPRLNNRDLTLITQQLATLSQSGMPLEETLGAVSRQTEKKSARRVLAGLRARVLEGLSLADACAQYPKTFSPLYRATIAAGETSGKLDDVLEQLADHLENREQVHQKIQLALIYPLLLTVISILVVIGLLTYVVPEIVEVFDNLGQNLPTLTRWLIATSDFFRDNGLLLILVLLATWTLFRLLLRLETFQYKVHKLLIRLPVIGRFSRVGNSARFTRTLAILTNSGVELLESLRIASRVIPNLAMRSAVENAAVKVREGDSLSRVLEQSGIFPPIAVHLIASGESSGQMGKALRKAADTQEREIRSVTEMLVGIFEPMLILFMGGIVLVIVISILLPIFEMNQLVR